MSTENVKIPENENPKPGTKAFVEAELAAAKAELEALKAEKEALMAEKEAADAEPEAPSAPKEDVVEIFIPRTPGNTDPNLLIVLNGKNSLLPKGQKSIVPKAVAAEYERSKNAQYKMDNAIFEMVEQAKQQALAAGIKSQGRLQ